MERREKLRAEVGSDFSITFNTYCNLRQKKIENGLVEVHMLLRIF